MHRDRHIRVRGTPKTEPDIRRLSRALLALAMAQAKAEQEAQQQPGPASPAGKNIDNPPRRSA